MKVRLLLMVVAAAIAASGLAGGAPVYAQQKAAAEAPLPANVPEKMPFDIPYGAPISLAQARRAMAATMAEAARRHWAEACAIVEPNGQLVMFEKMDDTQYGGIQVAMDKARSTALFRRSTDVFSEAIDKGHPSLLMLAGANAVPGGGLPIVVGGKLIGGFGCSGGAGEQDAFVTEAGLKALNAAP